MRDTQASVKMHDTQALWDERPLAEVRYDLRDSSAAYHHSWDLSLSHATPGLVALGRKWIARGLGLQPSQVIQAEETIDLRTVERMENGVATTCGGFLL